MISSKSDLDVTNKSRSSASVSDNQNTRNSDSTNNLSIGNLSVNGKSGPDWSIDAINGSHFWVDTNLSGDLCYLSETECEKNGMKKKCTSCKVVIHEDCLLKLKFQCRLSFREAGVRDYRDEKNKEHILLHHWVHKKRQDGKCKQCGKSFQSKFSFNSKEIVAMQCSWCKSPYHNKPVCFPSSLLNEECSKGQHYNSIIPPSWIIKMPLKHSFQSSVRKSRSPESTFRHLLKHQASFPASDSVSQNKTTLKECTSDQFTMTKSISLQSTSIWNSSIPFVIKPIPNNPPSKPLIVFLNPKSGGNAGLKLIRKFQWLLNPRQVFDISDGGPKLALELFGRVTNLRILVCGGDGTVGWILSELDLLKISPSPPIAILPLGTGNDLARTSNWGGGYSDEPLSKIISCVEEGSVKSLDRWSVTSQLIYDLPQYSHDFKEFNSNNNIYSSDSGSPSAVLKLPLNVFNNYFSLGADAATALEFHESREANPEKFTSRLKNKMFYVGVGGKDVLKRTWKDLSDHISLVCDDIDYTPKIKEMKPHLILFLNIPRYSAGTLPWGNPSSGFEPQSLNDEKFEVMGLTAASLAALQVGGHADRICQCSSAVVTTSKTIPMQMDGEPFRLLPSQIEIRHHNTAQIIMKPKRRTSIPLLSDGELRFSQDFDQTLKLSIFVIPLVDYEEYGSDKNKILESARFYGMFTEKGGSTLSCVRNRLLEINSDTCQLDSDFAFFDATTSDRFFRIDRSKEDCHYLMDICFEDVFVLDPKLPSNITLNHCEQHPTKDQMHEIGDRCLVTINYCEVQDADYDTYDCSVQKDRTVAPEDNTVLGKYVDEEDLNNHYLNACKQSQLDLVQGFILDGADFLALDPDGMSGLHLAASHGNVGVVHYLINNAPKALLDRKDERDGQTAFHKAAQRGQKSICALLISAGASVSSKDKSMKTASQLTNDPLLLQYLQKEEVLENIKNDIRKTNI